jgi:hypothetical protein
VRAGSGLDLVAPPFAAHRAVLASPDDYTATQALGRDMRAGAVEAFRYLSARDAEGGVNVAVLTPVVFRGVKPRGFETWHCTATRARVEFLRRDYFTPAHATFARDLYLVGGTLPAPAA